jgi:histidyl-tRNA synthetase
MDAQAVAVDLSGPDFFIIDFTAEKTAALSLARRLRDGGASVARDIISRGLEESIAYARAQRVRHVLVVGSPRTGAGEVLMLELGSGGERTAAVSDVLARPERYFRGAGGAEHA